MSDRDQRARNSLKAQGRTPNDQRARRTTSIAITQEAREALDARAAREGKSISRLIEEWVLGRPSPRTHKVVAQDPKPLRPLADETTETKGRP